MLVAAPVSSMKTRRAGAHRALPGPPGDAPLGDIGPVLLRRPARLMGWPAPPPHRRYARLGNRRRGADHADRGDRDRSGQEQLQHRRRWMTRVRWSCGGACGRRASPRSPKAAAPCIIAMEACCGAHHLGRLLAAQGPPGAADVTGICPALRQGAEERRSRCGGDRRGGDPADDAVCRAEEPRNSSTCRRCIAPATGWLASERR